MLKIFHKYLLQKMLITFLSSVIIISLCLVSLNLLKLTKHAQYNLTFGLFLTLIGYLNLFILAFSVPLSVLVASLLVFGKMAADNEITAFRASGLRISQIAFPALIFSVLVSFFMLYINGVVYPKGHHKMNRLEYLTSSIKPISLFTQRESNYFGDYSIFVDRIENDKMFDIYVVEVRGDTTANIRAKWGELSNNPGSDKMMLKLYDADISIPTEGGIVREHDRILSIEFDMKTLFKAFRSVKTVDDLTMKELIIRRRMAREMLHYGKYKAFIDMCDLLGRPIPEDGEALMKHIRRMVKVSMTPAILEEDTNRVRRRYLFEINKRLVLSISCFAFAMIAIPLSIRVHRREKTVNILIGVMIALLYYTVILVVEKSGQTVVMQPHMIIWLPPIVTVLLGLRLFKRLKVGL